MTNKKKAAQGARPEAAGSTISGQNFTTKHVQIVKISKLKQTDKLRLALGHNLRTDERHPAHIDATRTRLNQILCGGDSIKAIQAASDAIMATVSKQPRKDFVRWLELVISLPANSGIDENQFFKDSLAWCNSFFEVPILSAIIHHDEDAPHVHIAMVPLFDGRMIGSTFTKMNRYWPMQQDFNAAVGAKYGLSLPEPKETHSRAAREQATADCIQRMKLTIQNQPPEFWDAVRQMAITDPTPLMKFYRVEYAAAKGTKAKSIHFAGKSKSIHIVTAQNAPEKEQSLSCVGFAQNTPEEPPQKTFTRCAIDEQPPADYFDGDCASWE